MLHLVRDHLGAAIATETACWFQHPQVRGPGARQQVPAAQTDALEATMPEPVRDAIAILPGKKHKIWNTGDEPLRLLCCCAPCYEHEDTVITEKN